MSIFFHAPLVLAAFLLTPYLHVQGFPNNPQTVEENQQVIQTPSPQPLKPSTTPQVGSSQTELQATRQSVAAVSPSSSLEPKESFSQLTLFLFASGLALFIALLGWSDQIGGIDKDTKDLEERFLRRSRIKKSHFVDIVKPESPDEQLLALTQAVGDGEVSDGEISTKVSLEVLRDFAMYVSKYSRLEKLSAYKYNIVIGLTIVLFIAGIVSLFTTPTQHIRPGIPVRVEMVVLIVPTTLIGILLIVIIYSASLEKDLRCLLNSMSDRV